MKEDRFIQENSKTWKYLEITLARLKNGGLGQLEGNELNDFITAYNRVCGHLSYSRTYYGNTGTTGYLNRLIASAHSFIYLPKTSSLRRLKLFLLKDFPLLLRQYKTYIVLSFLIFLLGSAVSFIYTMMSPDNAAAFLPQEILNSMGSGEGGSGSWDGTVMSSYIFTNNIRVGLGAFALGVTLGAGTAFLLVYNGFILGGVGAMAYHSGAGLRFWSLILPHGILELFAIFVCGAAGLMIGYSIINPGVYTRKDSFIMKGKAAVKLVCGTIPVFVVAGLIEGYVTPLPVSEELKLLFAFFTLTLLAFYILFCNVRHRDSGINL
ncbi:MAG: stage II sporulation protein M [Clostridiales bacterium]|jgi:uncharacterized membrane protein SpoIIM required for sporulation|nr:stage II sporulation protein M [Eubacteriales bacterium]MDH7565381.1 stage II sporulation protein M [Clostridiales bacterium]